MCATFQGFIGYLSERAVQELQVARSMLRALLRPAAVVGCRDVCCCLRPFMTGKETGPIMSTLRSSTLIAGLAATLPLAAAAVAMLSAQQSAPAYKDAKRPVAERVADLLGRMTLEEKVAQ